MGRTYSVLDIFNPINPSAINPYQKQGINAIRYSYYINNLYNASLEYSLSDESTLSYTYYTYSSKHNDDQYNKDNQHIILIKMNW